MEDQPLGVFTFPLGSFWKLLVELLPSLHFLVGRAGIVLLSQCLLFGVGGQRSSPFAEVSTEVTLQLESAPKQGSFRQIVMEMRDDC